VSKVWIRRYVPLYIAFAVTGIVMAFLFLRPEAALGLTVEVSAVPKYQGFTAGFKLVDPSTGQPETVVISAEALLPEGGFEAVNLATLDILQSTGDTGFKDFSGSGVNPRVDLPLPVSPNFSAIAFQELTAQLPVDATGDTQGLLFVDVSLIQTIPDAFGYGYGYRGGSGGGSIKFTVRYVPPAIAGTYNATVRAFSITGVELAASTTQFVVLPPFPAGSVVAAPTIYPISTGEALTRDLVVLQAKISADVAGSLVSVEVDPGLLNANIGTMDSISEFHPSILAKWGVDSGDASHLLPMEIIPQASPLTGLFSAAIKVVDIAGQEILLTGDAGALVNVVTTRSSFNIYVMPGANFISTPLQCTGDCSTGNEFNIATLLDQVYGNAKAGKTSSGDVVEAVWYYCPEIVAGDLTTTNCPSGAATGDFIGFTPGGTSNLTTMAAGKGYILISKDAAFKTFLEASDTQFPTTSVPVPIKIVITGDVTVIPPPQIPPGTVVKAAWNLVGLHSERDSTVGSLVQAVDTPTRLWLQVLAFANTVDILMDSSGNVVHDGQGKPLISVEQGLFQNVTFNTTNKIPAGGGFWLEMCGGSNALCVSNEIGPVLQP